MRLNNLLFNFNYIYKMSNQNISKKLENGTNLKEDKPSCFRSPNNMTRRFQIPHGHIASLDVCRLIASFLIIVGHVSPFYHTVNYSGDSFIGWILYIFYHIRRMALPFFLMASGFLYGKSINRGKALIPRFSKALKRVTMIYLASSIFYLIEPFNNVHLVKDIATYGILKSYYWHFLKLELKPLLWIIGGTKGNLWFLPALITSISVITLFLHLKREKYLPWAAMCMYVLVVCLFQMPTFLTESMDYFSYIRAYCQAFVFVGAGWWFSQQEYLLKKDAYILLAIAMSSQIIQDLILNYFYNISPRGYLSVGLLPALFGVFILIMYYPNLGKNTILQQAGSMTLGIYILHPLFIDLFDFINNKYSYLSAPVRDLIYPAAITISCLMVTTILSKIKLFGKLTGKPRLSIQNITENLQ